MSDAFERVRASLEASGSDFRDSRQNHFMATCPAHADKNPSLGVDDKGDKVMLRCYAGCFTDDVVRAMGLDLKDLFDGELVGRDKMDGTLIRSYLYETGDGQPWFWVDRFWPKNFRQRLPDVEPVRDLRDRDACKRLGLRGRLPILYHYPRVARKIAEGDCTVWFLDGEKDVETAERHGLVATCPPGFAKWDQRYAQALKGAVAVVMVVDQDKEKPNGTLGAGQANAITARQGFRAAGLAVRTLSPMVGKDLTDHFAAQGDVDDFVQDTSIYLRPRGMTAERLMTEEFTPLVYAVDKILPSGLAILAGSPKAGKTWVALGISLAVAAGGPALSILPTIQGPVLHLAREDGYRRLQSRMRLIMAGSGEPLPSALELIPAEQEWEGGDIGLAAMTEWAEEVRNPRLVVLDTLAKVEPDMGDNGRRGAYAGNYHMMARYKNWADAHDCTVLMIHHDNKVKEDGGDPFTRISGTRGITGAADTLLFLETKRGSHEGVLHITGRDVAEQSLDLFKSGPIWNCITLPR